MNLNKVILVGRIGKGGVTIRYTPTGKPVGSGSIAVDRKYTNSAGERISRVDWFPFECWSANVLQFMTEGKEVLLEGRLECEQYEADGITKYFTKIVALNISLGRDSQKEHEPPEVEAEEIAF